MKLIPPKATEGRNDFGPTHPYPLVRERNAMAALAALVHHDGGATWDVLEHWVERVERMQKRLAERLAERVLSGCGCRGQAWRPNQEPTPCPQCRADIEVLISAGYMVEE